MNEQNVLYYHALGIIRKKVMATEGFFLCGVFGKSSPSFATHSPTAVTVAGRKKSKHCGASYSQLYVCLSCAANPSAVVAICQLI